MRKAALALAALVVSSSAGAVEMEPVYQLQVLGGQSFFAGQRGSLGGVVSGYAAPALRLDDRWTLLPSLMSSYQGTQQVVDVLGTGSLFVEQLDNRIGLKGIFQAPGGRWKIKPDFSYKAELLRETRDEGWGSGLFDYQKVAFGTEVEYVYREPFSLRGSFDYYYLFFPNYVSLESQAGGDFTGAPLARELVGGHVLDVQAFSAELAFDAPLAREAALEGSYLAQTQLFANQRVVDATGDLTAPTRQDFFHSGSVSLRLPFEPAEDLRILARLNLGGSYNASNQNSFDAQRLQFIPQFYSYGEIKAGPSVAASYGDEQQPVVASLSGSWAYRRYPYRLSQNTDGTYLGSGVYQHTWMLSSTLRYPMSPHFGLLFNFQYGKADANTHFEQAYVYNYTVSNYLFGFSYDY